MKQTERFQAERGLSPAAFIGGTVDEMKRIPEKNTQPGFGGDNPEFMDRGKGGDKPDFADLISGKAKGRTSRDQVTFYRNVGNQGLQFSSVGGWVYEQAVKQKKGRPIPTEWFLQDIRDRVRQRVAELLETPRVQRRFGNRRRQEGEECLRCLLLLTRRDDPAGNARDVFAPAPAAVLRPRCWHYPQDRSFDRIASSTSPLARAAAVAGPEPNSLIFGLSSSAMPIPAIIFSV